MLPAVTIVVLCYNHIADTVKCLESLHRLVYPSYETILVDNGSTDGTAAIVRVQFPQVHVIQNGRNLGYAEGNNVGLRYALQHGSDHVLALNNDTVLDPYCLQYLLADMEAHSDAGAAAPKSLYMDSPELVYSAGGRIRANGSLAHVGGGRPDGPEVGRSQDTEWLTGCAILFRAAALRRVGLFEPRFFLLFEDADWSLRARRAGYRLRFVADARLRHKVSASFGKTWSPQYLYYYTRNGLLWLERNFSLMRKPRLYAVHLRNVRSEASAQSLNSADALLRQKAVWRGTIDYVLRRFGERGYGW